MVVVVVGTRTNHLACKLGQTLASLPRPYLQHHHREALTLTRCLPHTYHWPGWGGGRSEVGTSQVVGTASLIVERKFIHACGKVGGGREGARAGGGAGG